MAFKIVHADITSLSVDAIVNPTDRHYSGGGGVDYRIHQICGERLWEATDALPYLHLGEAKATEGFALPCKFIIHTSGPKWYDSHKLEIEILGSCYRNSVQLAHSLGCRSIAFPLISSKGKFFPKEVALKTAIDAILECLLEYPDMEIILTVYGKCYDVEIESAKGKANPSGYQRRARYYSSLLDTYYLSQGSNYNKLPDSYVIFFCEKDIIGDGKPLYVINSTIQQTGKLLKMEEQ